MKKNMLFTIEGFIANEPSKNEVFINGIQLIPSKDLSFAWGYNGSGPYELAKAILAKFSLKGDLDTLSDIVRKFTDTFVNGWGYGDFSVEINMFHWLRFHANYKGDIVFAHHISEEGEEWSADK